MSADTSRAQDLFVAALAISESANRKSFLDAKCAGDTELRRQVDDLLKRHDSNSTIDQTTAHNSSELTGPFEPMDGASVDISGTIIACKYRLSQVIGEGGMGTVFAADQFEPVKRRVAVKVVKAGMDSARVLARFEAERQALALMDHPNIARVFDAGATELGKPFFVMELVRGVPLTRFCDDNKLSIPERLNLFVRVCLAVQHAHQKGIMHRDLKPSNILVEIHDKAPVPKVIDFGLAKATSEKLTERSMHTEVGQILGTLEYMAPEQADLNNQDIDTRTDIYSLGVILYELLAGSPPFTSKQLRGSEFTEMLRMIRESDPPTPSSRLSTSDALPSIAANRNSEPNRLMRMIHGDLDWIVMKALEKDRARRYETANGLAMDIQRYLADEPVLAGAPGASYRLRKLLRRNKGLVLASSAVAATLLVGVAGVITVQAKANHDLNHANSELSKVNADLKSANTSLDKERRRAVGNEGQAIDAVKKFRDTVADNNVLKNSPALADLRKTLLKEPLAFFHSLRDRLQSERDTSSESLARLAAASMDLGRLTQEIGDQQNAITAFREAQSMYGTLAATDSAAEEYQESLEVAHRSIGFLLSKTGKPAEAEKAYETTLTIAQKLADTHPNTGKYQNDLADGHAYLAQLFYELGRKADARNELAIAVAIQQGIAHAGPANVEFQKELAHNLSSLGETLVELGQTTEARKQFDEALAIKLELAALNPSDDEMQYQLATTHRQLARLLTLTGKLPEALKAHNAALPIQQKLAAEHPTVTKYLDDLAVTQNNLGYLLYNLGQPAEARKEWEAGRGNCQKLVESNPTVTDYQFRLIRISANLANAAQLAGQLVESQKAWEAVLPLAQKLVDANPKVADYQSMLATARLGMAFLLESSAQPTQAMKEFAAAAAVLQKLAADNPAVQSYASLLGLAFNSTGVLQRAFGLLTEAEQSFDSARAIAQKLADANPTITRFQADLGNYLYNLGLVASETDRRADAQKWYGMAIATLKKLADAKKADSFSLSVLARTQNDLGVLLRTTGKPADAKKAFEAARTICDSTKESERSLPNFLRQRAKSIYNLGILLRDAGQKSEARMAFDEALAAREKLAQSEKDLSDEYSSELGETLQDLARLDLDGMQYAKARDRLQQAITWQKKAFTVYPTNPRYRKLLADHLSALIRACAALKDIPGASVAQAELDKLNASASATEK